MKTAVQFGAGAIGRGLLGDLLGESGYNIIFIDTDPEIVNQINSTNSFDLLEMKDNNIKTIKNSKAINILENEKEVIEAVAKADIVTTSVGVNNLPNIATTIGKGILLRSRSEKSNKVDVLAFENAHMASNLLKKLILEKLPKLDKTVLDSNASFANTVTDRSVMNKTKDGKSIIMVGDTFEASIAQDELSDPTSEPIKYGDYTNKIGLYVDRKFFIVNGGHCIAAYLGSNKGYNYMWQSFTDDEIFLDVKKAMEEIGDMLSIKYEIEKVKMDEYIKFILDRYVETSRVNGDEIVRVGRNLIQKINKKDRLIMPALQIEAMNKPLSHLAKGIASAYLYDLKIDKQSQQVQAYIEEYGIDKAVNEFSGLDEDSLLYEEIINKYNQLKEK